MVTETHVGVESEHGRLRALILRQTGSPGAPAEYGCGRILLEEVVDVVLILMLLAILLESFGLLLDFLHALVERVQRPHLWEFGLLCRVSERRLRLERGGRRGLLVGPWMYPTLTELQRVFHHLVRMSTPI